MKSIIKKIGLLLIFLPLFFMALILLIPVSASISESLARALAPPEYPNSTLVDSWESGGTELLWDRKTYMTRDSPKEVLSFMEAHLGDFEMTVDEMTGKTTYHQGECNESHLAKLASLGLEPRPCASITIFDDPAQPDMTTIWIWISWPAP